MTTFRTFRLWWLLFVSMPLVCNQFDRLSACIYYGGEFDELRFFLFRPDLGGEPAWLPFYYTRFYKFGDNPYDWPGDAGKFKPELFDDERAVLEQWQHELADPAVKFEDIYGLLYQTNSDSLFGHLDALDRFFGKNSFVTALQKPQNRALWSYLLDLKFSEKHTTLGYDWTLPRTEVTALERERDSLLQHFNTVLQAGGLSPFLQTRYAFTTLRLSLYAGGKANQVRELFRQYLEPLPDSTVLRTWALHYLAEVTSDALQRNYLNSLVFDRCDSKKQRIKQVFESYYTSQVLSKAKNAHEKAVILTLRELNNPGKSIDGIRQLLTIAPDDHYLQLVISREINKIEDWLFTPEVLGIAGSMHYSTVGKNTWETSDDYYDLPKKWRTTDLNYLRQLRRILIDALPGSQTNRDFIKLAIAQLYLLDRQPVKAMPFVRAVQPDGFLFELQKKLLELQLTLQTRDIANPSVQEQLTRQLRWLEQRQSSILAGPRTFTLALSLCASFFEKKGMKTEAFLLRNRGNLQSFFNDYHNTYYSQISQFDRLGSTGDVRQAIRLIEKTDKTAFEQMITEPYEIAYPFYDLLGTMLMREARVEEGYEWFHQVPENFWKTAGDFIYYLDEDPFNRVLPLRDRPSFDVYTKPTMAKKLLELEKIATENPEKAAEAWLQLGNAWFNFSRYGHSWMMLNYSWSSYKNIYRAPFDLAVLPDYAMPRAGFERNYVRAEMAIFYYKKVIGAASSDPEMQARAAYMLAQIDKEQFCWNSMETYTPGKSAVYYYEHYRESDFYKTHPCSGIEEFMGKK
ncbi:MAG: hypothetical protein KDD14_19010 [Saprospiraceae bacterium]|nr:hypothetical protein [Saprospiraceae bacterium]